MSSSFASKRGNSRMLVMVVVMMFMTSLIYFLFIDSGKSVVGNSSYEKATTELTSSDSKVSKDGRGGGSTRNLLTDVELYWGGPRAKFLEGGQSLTLSLDNKSGSGFRTRDEFLFGRIEMDLKLVGGNSAGTVTTYYLSSLGSKHDEIDFEFLGNETGEPYTLHTNIFSQGKGEREQQFRLWFDPTTSFHTYTFVWNPKIIIWLVDNTPIRIFENNELIGVPFLTSQPMRLWSTLWCGDEWATQGGRVKTNWKLAPFIAAYRNFKVNACVISFGSSSCASSAMSSNSVAPTETWQTQVLSPDDLRKLRWVQKNYMLYNYCTDQKRFPKGYPPECMHSSYM